MKSHLYEKPAFHGFSESMAKQVLFPPQVKTTAHAHWNLKQTEHAQ
jgi:hypothetical protein